MRSRTYPHNSRAVLKQHSLSFFSQPDRCNATHWAVAVLGTLYDQLTYPGQIGEGDTKLTKERLIEILDMVDLGYLAAREGVLDSEINWEDECSLGVR